MAEAPTILIENLVKRYPASGRTPARRVLRELGLAALGLPAPAGAAAGDFAAVDGLSLEVSRGEALALIGRNGCGKTTTLRVVAGLLRPDEGRVRVRGRLQALIALGAGFNDRLTGRQNVFNNAAVLGLGAREAKRIVGGVIDFAELSEFIDSPVGTYSSGMRARLGFSVAVHLDPEVLIIDEILGVGDFAFQNKCFAHMNRLQARGVTILLVSHSHNKVLQMCQRAAWLDHGRLRQLGAAKAVVKAYLDEETRRTRPPEIAAPEKAAGPRPREAGPSMPDAESYGPAHGATGGLSGVELHGPDRIGLHAEAVFRYRFHLGREVEGLNVTLNVFAADGTLMTSVSTLNGDLLAARRSGWVSCRVVLPRVNLAPGSYVAGLAVHEGHSYLFRGPLLGFAVDPSQRMTWGLVDLDPTVVVEG